MAEITKESETIINNAKQLHRESKFKDAEPLLKTAVSNNPKDQKLSIQYGYNLFSQERYNDAEKELKRTIKLSPNSWNGQQALFLLAKSQYRIGKNKEASATIEKMKNDHPDSGWLPQVWILEAEMKGINTADAEEKLKRQNAAEKVYAEILRSKKTKSMEEKISALDKLVLDNRGLPIALAALESKGNLLSLTTNTQEAISVFDEIITELKVSAPKSRIIQTANSRLAALHHRNGDRKAAQGYYAEILKIDPNNTLAESARLKSSAIDFEFLQHASIEGQGVPDEKWINVRQLITSAKEDMKSTSTRIIADLMILETYLWSHDYRDLLPLGQKFINDYHSQRKLFKRDYATACVVLSRAYKETKHYEEALQFTQTVFELYPTELEIWDKMDHIERAYYDMIESLYSLGEKDEGNRKFQEFQIKFPQSEFIQHLNARIKSNIYDVRRIKGEGK